MTAILPMATLIAVIALAAIVWRELYSSKRKKQ